MAGVSERAQRSGVGGMSRGSKARVPMRDSRIKNSPRSETSGTAGGPVKQRGSAEVPLTNDFEEFQPLPHAQAFDWVHAAKVAGIVLAGVAVALSVVITAVTITKDVGSLEKKIDDLGNNVDSLGNRAISVEAKVDNVQLSINEARRDVIDQRYERARGTDEGRKPSE